MLGTADGVGHSTFCMASRRAGESAPLREREKPLVAGNRWGASGCIGLRLGQRLGPHEPPPRGTGSLRSRRARRAASLRTRTRVPTASYVGRLAAERAPVRRNGPREHGGLVVNDAAGLEGQFTLPAEAATEITAALAARPTR
jgi:hypothetical protein